MLLCMLIPATLLERVEASFLGNTNILLLLKFLSPVPRKRALDIQSTFHENHLCWLQERTMNSALGIPLVSQAEWYGTRQNCLKDIWQESSPPGWVWISLKQISWMWKEAFNACLAAGIAIILENQCISMQWLFLLSQYESPWHKEMHGLWGRFLNPQVE